MGDVVDIRRPTPGHGIACIGFKRLDAGTGSLRGFADLHIGAWHLTLFGCPVHEQNGRRWVQLPSKPQIDKAGQAVLDEASGKPRYFPVLAFDDVETLRRFSDAACTALDACQPGWDQ
jgi:hypothetical protein